MSDGIPSCEISVTPEQDFEIAKFWHEKGGMVDYMMVFQPVLSGVTGNWVFHGRMLDPEQASKLKRCMDEILAGA